MKKRIFAKILRKLYWVIICFCAGILTRQMFLGEINTFQIIICIVFYIEIIWNIVATIRMEATCVETLKYLNMSLAILDSMHTERYRCFLSGNKEGVTEYTRKIQNSSEELMNCAEYCLLLYSGKKKKREKILKIMEKIEQINTTITPIQLKQDL